MVMSAAIFLLRFFDGLSKNIGNFEVKKEGKKSKILLVFLLLGYHSIRPP
jgi:hypothetical protein